MPLPNGLVEKNGSVARAATSGAHALAGVGDGDADIVAGGEVGAVRLARRGRSRWSACRPSGIASRALMARLRIAFSSWFSSHKARPASASSSVRIAIAPPIVWRSISRIVSITRLTATGAIRIRWMREKASNWVVSLAPRRPDSSAASAIRFSRGSSTPRGDDLEPADHRGQQIVEIVGDAAGQLADRLHLLRLAQRLLGPLALADLGLEPVERGAQIGGALGDPRLEHLRRPSFHSVMSWATPMKPICSPLGPQRGCEIERSQRHSPSPRRKRASSTKVFSEASPAIDSARIRVAVVGMDDVAPVVDRPPPRRCTPMKST